MENCVFCRIVKGKLPSYKIAENDHFLAFLSISPHQTGHTLIIPKIHVDDFMNMEDNLLTEILIFAQKITAALKKAFQPKTGKIGLMVAGLEVPHAHLHLIPMDDVQVLNFDQGKPATPEQLKSAQEKILSSLK